MPKYLYKCERCKKEFEFFKVLSDEVVECENCGEKDGEKLTRLISATIRLPSKEPFYKSYGRKGLK